MSVGDEVVKPPVCVGVPPLTWRGGGDFVGKKGVCVVVETKGPQDARQIVQILGIMVLLLTGSSNGGCCCICGIYEGD